MKELDNFLSNLSDHELAIFFGNRYNTFLHKSKEKIDNEIKKRNLSSEKLKLFLDTKLNIESVTENRSCLRCGSEKLYIETDYKEIPISEFSSAEIATDSYRCRLCGFNANKAKPKNLLDRIGRVFKKSRNSRVNKWNEI